MDNEEIVLLRRRKGPLQNTTIGEVLGLRY